MCHLHKSQRVTNQPHNHIHHCEAPLKILMVHFDQILINYLPVKTDYLKKIASKPFPPKYVTAEDQKGGITKRVIKHKCVTETMLNLASQPSW